MSDPLRFWLPGYTQKGGRHVATMGKARPRFAINFLSVAKIGTMLSDPQALKRYLSSCIRAHMPADYKREVNRLRDMAAYHAPRTPPTDPVTVGFKFYFGRPHSRRVANGDPYLGIPDLDNLTGTVLDALTGLFWKDDRQIWKMTDPVKLYGKSAGTHVEISYRSSDQPGLFKGDT